MRSSRHDTTPLAELRRDIVAAAVVFSVIGFGAFAVVALMNAHF